MSSHKTGLPAQLARRRFLKRVASAVGEGSATISMVHEYLRSV